MLNRDEVIVSRSGVPAQPTDDAPQTRESTAGRRALTPVVGRAGAALPLRVARNVGRNVASTAGQVQRIGKGLADVAHAVALDRRNARAKGKQLVVDARVLLKQARATVDPREIAGGFAGLTAGEVVGGAVGGVAGTLVGGPAGAIVGAELGAFTAGMLGMKLGADAARDLTITKGSARTPAPPATGDAVATGATDPKRGERLGEIVGLTSGAAVGRIVAGPIGGLVGAALGEIVGGQVGQETAGVRPIAAAVPAQPTMGAAKRLNRLGKRTAGEAATILAGGAVGAVFGPGGRAAGRRLGLVVGRQIEWEKLSIHPQDGQAPRAPRAARGAPPAGTGGVADVNQDAGKSQQDTEVQ